MKVRFTQQVGWHTVVTVWWGDCGDDGSHRICHELKRGDGHAPADAFENYEAWQPEPGTPCRTCAEPFPADDADACSGARVAPIWDTPSGELEPGCLYWKDWDHKALDGAPRPCPTFSGGWADCPGRHLMVVCPNGRQWDIDSRANNCTRPNDDRHRCWVRHGDPETGDVTVDKDGATCEAGAGSIQAGDYHGYLHDGEFVPA